jgi:signal recognition particle subunit SRP54
MILSNVGRMLGMGDIKALLEMARGLELQGDENQVKRLMSGRMTIEDFYAQMESANKMGFRNIIENLGMSGMVKEDKLDEMQTKMEKWRFIIQSMTNQERKDPDIINESRRKRISRGCGLAEGEIKEMIKQYNTSKNFMKQNKGRGMGGFFRKFGLG